jgi:hypothetical protein
MPGVTVCAQNQCCNSNKVILFFFEINLNGVFRHWFLEFFSPCFRVCDEFIYIPTQPKKTVFSGVRQHLLPIIGRPVCWINVLQLWGRLRHDVLSYGLQMCWKPLLYIVSESVQNEWYGHLLLWRVLSARMLRNGQ